MRSLYRPSLALLTDLYQVTMAYGYWQTGRHLNQAVFHLSFRRHPFDGGFAVVAGIGPVLDFLADLRFEPDDLEFLAGLDGNDGNRLFEGAFLEFLGELRPEIDLDAMPEGTVSFEREPILRVQGPLAESDR